MNVHNRALTAAAALAALGTITASTASAGPPSADHAPQVHYTASVEGGAAAITVPDGRLVTDNGQLQIRTASDQVVAGVPLELHVNDVVFPIDAAVTGDTARLTPNLDPARARYDPIAKPVAGPPSAERQQDAVTRAQTFLAQGFGISAVLGAINGGILGCLLGGVTGAVTTAPLGMLLGLGPAAGCLIGAATVAPGGAVVGVINGVGPVAIPAFLQYLFTTNT